MQHLFAPQPDVIAVAREFYDCFNNQPGLYRSATVSVVKTAELDELKTLFREIAGQARNDGDSQVSFEGDPGSLQTFGYATQKIYFDLGDYIQKLSPGRCAEFQAALDKCVIYKAHTGSYYSAGTETLQIIRAFSGLSVYIPQQQYPGANEWYGRLKWAEQLQQNK
jgi:hypothetical protein